uniref:Uncharacterized protein n=1 Tax=Megaselia scalaris TaxID=36166 RepID=T1GZG8_MEGSC
MEPETQDLNAEALKRKERLRRLRDMASGKTNSTENSINDAENLPKPIFRSYKPKDESLQENSIEQKTAGDIENKVED